MQKKVHLDWLTWEAEGTVLVHVGSRPEEDGPYAHWCKHYTHSKEYEFIVYLMLRLLRFYNWVLLHSQLLHYFPFRKEMHIKFWKEVHLIIHHSLNVHLIRAVVQRVHFLQIVLRQIVGRNFIDVNAPSTELIFLWVVDIDEFHLLLLPFAFALPVTRIVFVTAVVLGAARLQAPQAGVIICFIFRCFRCDCTFLGWCLAPDSF